MTKSLVIFHSADFDGIFCREIAKKFLGDTAEYVGWTHGDPLIPFPSEGAVYVMDLSPECLSNIPAHQERMIWIDHHKSAIEKFSPGIAGLRIDGVAACRLAWQWFISDNAANWIRPHLSDILASAFPDKSEFYDHKVSEPLAVRLAGEYDCWDKRDPRADLLQHGLRSKELTDLDWAFLLNTDIPENLKGTGFEMSESELQCSHLLQSGAAVQYAKTQENKDIITSYGFDIIFEGLIFLACNHARYNSHLFTAGIKPHHEALFGFKWDGDQWQISLYHIDDKTDIDLSLIAVKFGGGGHRGACGFRMSTVQMHEMGII